jgi:pantoate--beta-alanine ligase
MPNNLTLFFTTDSFKNWRKQHTLLIGFVPTMGNLHTGHLKLLELALENYSTVVLSIFVNPTQFGPSEDYEKYPRTLEQDTRLVEELLANYPNSQVILYAPKNPSEVYHKDFSSFINPGTLGSILEGERRPGHFQGVCSVVNILLNLVQPETLYLGKKDYQQWRILEKMITDLHIPVKVIGGETVRDNQGLALSSRNRYLTSEQLTVAQQFPKALQQLKNLLVDDWQKEQSWDAPHVKKILETFCQSSELNWDYCFLRQQNLQEISEESKQVVILAVIKVGHVRLLDNLEFELK